jgi:hypothetical protein
LSAPKPDSVELTQAPFPDFEAVDGERLSRLRAVTSMSALLDILDATDNRPKAQVHELRPAASRRLKS